MNIMYCISSNLFFWKESFENILNNKIYLLYAAAAAAKSLQSCLTLQPHRQQPTRLHRPWDSLGKNTGVGCHFLLQCMKVKSESEIVQSCPTLSDPMGQEFAEGTVGMDDIWGLSWEDLNSWQWLEAGGWNHLETSLLIYQTPNLEWLESSLGWDCQLEPHLMQVSSGCPNQRHFQKPGVPREPRRSYMAFYDLFVKVPLHYF